MLTVTALRNFKPKSKTYKASGRDGMYVTVSPTGTVTFRFDYRLNGRRETLTIGRYGLSGISLTERPGLHVRIIVNRDLVLRPYQSLFFNRGDFAMSTPRRLRLGPLPKTESVKLTFVCLASLKADIDRYAVLHAQAYGETVDAMTLIPYMPEAFMARDREFRRDSGHRTSAHAGLSAGPRG